jgi:hypothetical protein
VRLWRADDLASGAFRVSGPGFRAAYPPPYRKGAAATTLEGAGGGVVPVTGPVRIQDERDGDDDDDAEEDG